MVSNHTLYHPYKLTADNLYTIIFDFLFAESDNAFISNSAVRWVCVHHFSSWVIHILYTIKSKSLEKQKEY